MLGLVVLAAFPWFVQTWEQQNIFTPNEYIEPHTTALVFGAGLKSNGEPSDALADRLITAAELYLNGTVQNILVSGDAISDEYYDEPGAMKEFLVTWGVPAEDIVEDFAGSRTYDSCIRAEEIWGLNSAVLVTQEFHLPRALFTCNALGVRSIGVIADRQPYILEEYYEYREWMALYKAFLDVYIWKPDYISAPTETTIP